MTPASARASYRSQIAQHGETVTIRRINQLPAPPSDLIVLARVLVANGRDMVANISTSDRTLVILAEDIEAAGWTLAKNDKVLLRGSMLNIQSIDDDKCRVAGVLIAYEIVANGAG